MCSERHDTAAFALNTIATWWRQVGRLAVVAPKNTACARYPVGTVDTSGTCRHLHDRAALRVLWGISDGPERRVRTRRYSTLVGSTSWTTITHRAHPRPRLRRSSAVQWTAATCPRASIATAPTLGVTC
jgi:hypothetical protein